MSGLVDALAILAVAVLVITRQLGTRRMDADRRWWLLPAVLVFLALWEPALLDPHHRTASALLLTAELLIGAAIGLGWASTTTLWRTPDGVLWSRTTRTGVAVWTVGIALRAALFGVGAVLGLRQDTSALLVALAVTLLIRSGALVHRARSLGPVIEKGAAYGGGLPRSVKKEPV
ncbi:DUF1453 domain-containing protein [Streptomyces fructofermentans]|uniref:DUF1453 domain-containing protein n=1 Tax=Streptomyces fructofermentans TaxID=152141 RepID=UPI0033D719A9